MVWTSSSFYLSVPLYAAARLHKELSLLKTSEETDIQKEARQWTKRPKYDRVLLPSCHGFQLHVRHQLQSWHLTFVKPGHKLRLLQCVGYRTSWRALASAGGPSAVARHMHDGHWAWCFWLTAITRQSETPSTSYRLSNRDWTITVLGKQVLQSG